MQVLRPACAEVPAVRHYTCLFHALRQLHMRRLDCVVVTSLG